MTTTSVTPPPSSSSGDYNSQVNQQQQQKHVPGSRLASLAAGGLVEVATNRSEQKSSIGGAQESTSKMNVGGSQGMHLSLPAPVNSNIASVVKSMQQPLTMNPSVQKDITAFRELLKTGDAKRMSDMPELQALANPEKSSQGSNKQTTGGGKPPAPGPGGSGQTITPVKTDSFLGTNVAEAAMDFMEIMLQKMVTMNAMSNSFAQFATEFQQYSYDKADNTFKGMMAQGVGQLAAGMVSLGGFAAGAASYGKMGSDYAKASTDYNRASQEMQEKFGGGELSTAPVRQTVVAAPQALEPGEELAPNPEVPPQVNEAPRPREGDVQIGAEANPVEVRHTDETKDRIKRDMDSASRAMSSAAERGNMRSGLINSATEFFSQIGNSASTMAKATADKNASKQEAMSSMSQEGLSRTIQFYNTVSQQATDAASQSTQFMQTYAQSQAAVLQG